MTRILILLLLMSGCGGGGRRGDGGPPPPGDGAVPDARLADGALPSDGAMPTDGARDDGAPGPDAPGRDAAAPDAGPPLMFCRITCTVADDCASPSAAYDADNYSCDSGLCVYTGCNDDSECASTFASADYVCRDVGGLQSCVERCAAAADCGTGTPAFDSDNYACEGNVCRYTGCNSDTECEGTYASSRYICRDVLPPDTGLPIPTATRNCVLGCATTADCATPSAAFDADNYECRDGACIYTGCNDDAECQASFMMTRYVCR